MRPTLAPRSAIGFSGTVVLASGYTGTDRTICVVGFQSGSRDLVGVYIGNANMRLSPTTIRTTPSNEDGSLTVAAPGVLGNDTDANSNPLTVATPRPVSRPEQRHADVERRRLLHLRPERELLRDRHFTYRANDGFANSNLATVTITVDPVNDAPSFIKGADVTVAEDSGAYTQAGWATSISKGPRTKRPRRSASSSTPTRTLACSRPARPSSPTRRAHLHPGRATHSASATITLKITDNGGIANGGVERARRRHSRSPSPRSTTRRPARTSRSPRPRTPRARPRPTAPTSTATR